MADAAADGTAARRSAARDMQEAHYRDSAGHVIGHIHGKSEPCAGCQDVGRCEERDHIEAIVDLHIANWSRCCENCSRIATAIGDLRDHLKSSTPTTKPETRNT